MSSQTLDTLPGASGSQNEAPVRGSTPRSSGPLATLREWVERARSRGELRRLMALENVMGPSGLRGDLGYKFNELLRESEKPFWRA